MSCLNKFVSFCRWVPRWLEWRRWREAQSFKVDWGYQESVAYVGRGVRANVPYSELETNDPWMMRLGVRLSNMRLIGQDNREIRGVTLPIDLAKGIFEDIRADYAMQGGEAVLLKDWPEE